MALGNCPDFSGQFFSRPIPSIAATTSVAGFGGPHVSGKYGR
jgi:hypothetical protein